MKKKTLLLSALLLSVSFLTGCSSVTKPSSTVEELTVSFVPSRDPEEILSKSKKLPELLKKELSNQGVKVDKVNIEVGNSFEDVGDKLASGEAHVGFLPGGTYVLYDNDADIVLTATRAALNHDSENGKDWNVSPTESTDVLATSYRALVIAGPSEQGKSLANKINSGQELTASDIKSVKWGFSSNTTSPAGYVYPSLWLDENFNIKLQDIVQKTMCDNYKQAFDKLATGEIDVMVTYADARTDYKDAWNTEFKRAGSIWDETNVIGVTAPIYNDTICVSKNANISNEMKNAIQKAFINIGNSTEGADLLSIYNHKGYDIGKRDNYKNEREAQKMIVLGL